MGVWFDRVIKLLYLAIIIYVIVRMEMFLHKADKLISSGYLATVTQTGRAIEGTKELVGDAKDRAVDGLNTARDAAGNLKGQASEALQRGKGVFKREECGGLFQKAC